MENMNNNNSESLQQQIRVFVSYCHADKVHRDRILTHLNTLKRMGIISIWTDIEILPGKEIAKAIEEELHKADIILLLISADFLSSYYCADVEATVALERHNRNEACVIPIIVESCLWQKTHFGELNALPEDGHAVTSSHWVEQKKGSAEIYTDIANGIHKSITHLVEHRKRLPHANTEKEVITTSPLQTIPKEIQDNYMKYYECLNNVSRNIVNDVEEILDAINNLCTIAYSYPTLKTDIFKILCTYIVNRTNPSKKNGYTIDREWVNMDDTTRNCMRPHWDVQYILNILFRDHKEFFKGLKANFENAQLQNVNFAGMTLKNVNFKNASLQHARMYTPFSENGMSEFINCDFRGAYLDGANITRANLSGSNFSFAKMRWSNLYGSILTKTIFDGADMTAALLGEGKVNASFKYTILDGAEISQLNFINEGDEKTTIPFKTKHYTFLPPGVETG